MPKHKHTYTVLRVDGWETMSDEGSVHEYPTGNPEGFLVACSCGAYKRVNAFHGD